MLFEDKHEESKDKSQERPSSPLSNSSFNRIQLATSVVKEALQFLNSKGGGKEPSIEVLNMLASLQLVEVLDRGAVDKMRSDPERVKDLWGQKSDHKKQHEKVASEYRDLRMKEFHLGKDVEELRISCVKTEACYLETQRRARNPLWRGLYLLGGCIGVTSSLTVLCMERRADTNKCKEELTALTSKMVELVKHLEHVGSVHNANKSTDDALTESISKYWGDQFRLDTYRLINGDGFRVTSLGNELCDRLRENEPSDSWISLLNRIHRETTEIGNFRTRVEFARELIRSGSERATEVLSFVVAAIPGNVKDMCEAQRFKPATGEPDWQFRQRSLVTVLARYFTLPPFEEILAKMNQMNDRPSGQSEVDVLSLCNRIRDIFPKQDTKIPYQLARLAAAAVHVSCSPKNADPEDGLILAGLGLVAMKEAEAEERAQREEAIGRDSYYIDPRREFGMFSGLPHGQMFRRGSDPDWPMRM